MNVKRKIKRPAGDLDARISGIPCRIEVTYFFKQEPLGPSCDSDWDCYGYTNIEFDVLDRNGRPAPWLAKKMTADEKADIETAIEKANHA